MSGRDDTASQAVTQAAQRFWEERVKGRTVSVDDCLETIPGTPEHEAARASAINLIAEQAARLSAAVTLDGDAMETLGVASVPPAALATLSAGGPMPTIDGYDLISCMGRGGMGAVYEGYQQSTGRRVAVKFMLDAIGSSEAARKRFEREVEVVARLQHPGIVSVLDSGVRRGRYFYVMEYVAGRPLDDALKPGTCDPRTALQLIINVCEAVDYAHQRGILHRDLKPSNIIVDGDGHPHLLDFGLAKVFDPKEGDGGTHGALGLTVSGPGQLLGTIAYMSPEQAMGRHDETSVRTDVYALGAIAYELVSGKLPCGTSGSLREVLARITDVDPAAPSTLNRALTRDLDAVLLKALEKAPDKRYATAGDFAADLRRSLADEPVLARRVTTAGRAWRWVKRNRAISAVAATGLAALVAVSAVFLLQLVNTMRWALHERDIALESIAQMNATLSGLDPDKVQGQLTLSQFLDDATDRLNKSPPEHEMVEAPVREVFGSVYNKLGEYEKARQLQARALAIRERHAAGKDDPLLAAALHNYAAILWWDGAYGEAEKHYVRSLDMRRRLYQGRPDHKEIADSIRHLAACRLRLGKVEEARTLYEEALAMGRKRGSESTEVAQALNNLAKCLLEADMFPQAEGHFAAALAMIMRIEGPEKPGSGTAAVSQNYGECLLRRCEAHEIARSPEAALNSALAARESFERARRIRATIFPQGHHLLAASLSGLARADIKLAELSRALDLARQSVAMFQSTRRDDHPDHADGLGTLGMVHAAAGNAEDAADALTRALAFAERARPRAEQQVARLQGELGLALALTDRAAEGEHHLIKSYEYVRALRGPASNETVMAARRLVHFYTLRAQPDKADVYRVIAKLPADPAG